MSLVIVGALILGAIGGLLARSIFVGIALPILLIIFFVMWRYMESDLKKREYDVKEEENTPPVTVNNVPQQNPNQPEERN